MISEESLVKEDTFENHTIQAKKCITAHKHIILSQIGFENKSEFRLVLKMDFAKTNLRLITRFSAYLQTTVLTATSSKSCKPRRKRNNRSQPKSQKKSQLRRSQKRRSEYRFSRARYNISQVYIYSNTIYHFTAHLSRLAYVVYIIRRQNKMLLTAHLTFYNRKFTS